VYIYKSTRRKSRKNTVDYKKGCNGNNKRSSTKRKTRRVRNGSNDGVSAATHVSSDMNHQNNEMVFSTHRGLEYI
jgi:hypothetical protein